MNYFLFEHAKIKSFTLLAEVGGLVSLPMRKEKSPGREETRGPRSLTTWGLATYSCFASKPFTSAFFNISPGVFQKSFILFIKTACRLSLDLLDYFPEELLECYPVKTWRIPSKVPVEQGLSLQQQHVVLHRILDMPFHVLVPKFVLVKCINTLKVGSIATFVAFVLIFREIMVHYSVLWTAGGCCLGWHERKWRRRGGGGELDR